MGGENEDNETTLRLRRMNGDTPGPRAARQDARVGPDTQRRDPDTQRRDPDGGRAADGAREPAPGEANPLSREEGRPLDRRDHSP